MRAYYNIRFIEGPDVAEIQSQARKSSVGRIARGKSYFRYNRDTGTFTTKVNHNDRGYCKPAHKAVVRRTLKRSDRTLENRFQTQAEGQE